jgi:hypothetical protein
LCIIHTGFLSILSIIEAQKLFCRPNPALPPRRRGVGGRLRVSHSDPVREPLLHYMPDWRDLAAMARPPQYTTVAGSREAAEGLSPDIVLQGEG